MPYQRRSRGRRRRSFPRRAWKWNTVISGIQTVTASSGAELLILNNSTDYVIKIRKFMMWLHLGTDVWAGILKISNLVTTVVNPRSEPDDHSWLWWCPGQHSEVPSTAAPAYLPVILKTTRTLRPGEKLILYLRNHDTVDRDYTFVCKFMRIDN